MLYYNITYKFNRSIMYSEHVHAQCVQNALESAEKICAAKNLRLTQLRKKVLELVWASHGPVKAYDILDLLGTDKSPAKPPTVYRSLDFLTENGLVHKLNSLNAYVGCSHPTESHACYFLICNLCHEVKECCNRQLDKAIDTTTHSNKFKPNRITLEIEGICEHCS